MFAPGDGIAGEQTQIAVEQHGLQISAEGYSAQNGDGVVEKLTPQQRQQGSGHQDGTAHDAQHQPDNIPPCKDQRSAAESHKLQGAKEQKGKAQRQHRAACDGQAKTVAAAVLP